jgi:hypothetical protein
MRFEGKFSDYTCRILNGLLANMPVGLPMVPISEAYILDRSINILDSQNFWSGLQIHSIALTLSRNC